MRYLIFLVVPLLSLQNLVDKIPKGPTGINFQNLTLLGMFLAWLIVRRRRGGPLLLKNPMSLPLGAYIVLSFLGMWQASFFLDIDLPVSLSDPHVTFWKDYFTTMMFFFFAQGIFDEEREMEWMMFAMVAALPYMFRVHYAQLLEASQWHYSHDMRVKGTFTHLGSNELAAFYTQYGLLFMCLAAGMKVRWKKLVFAAAFGVCVWGTIYSYSRGAWMALALGIVLYGFLRSRALVVAMLGFVLVAPAILPASVVDRAEMTQSGGGELDSSAASRIDFWKLAWDYFLEHPLTGIGYHAFHHVNPAGLDTHNMYVKQMAELGIFGIALFMTMYIVALVIAVRLFKVADTPFLKAMGLGLMMCVIANMVLNIFGDRFSYTALSTFYWVLVGMAVRGIYIVRNRPPPVVIVDDDDTGEHEELDAAPRRASIFAG
jgi:putative inorganic carbon (hco3(-)) transporter